MAGNQPTGLKQQKEVSQGIQSLKWQLESFKVTEMRFDAGLFANGSNSPKPQKVSFMIETSGWWMR